MSGSELDRLPSQGLASDRASVAEREPTYRLLIQPSRRSIGDLDRQRAIERVASVVTNAALLLIVLRCLVAFLTGPGILRGVCGAILILCGLGLWLVEWGVMS